MTMRPLIALASLLLLCSCGGAPFDAAPDPAPAAIDPSTETPSPTTSSTPTMPAMGSGRGKGSDDSGAPPALPPPAPDAQAALGEAATSAPAVDASAHEAAAASLVQLAGVMFIPPAGTYHGSVGVTIRAPANTIDLWVTTDGSDPGPANPASVRSNGSNATILMASTTLRALATAPGFRDSPIGMAAYTVTP